MVTSDSVKSSPMVTIDIRRSEYNSGTDRNHDVLHYSLSVNIDGTFTITLPSGDSLNLDKIEAFQLRDNIYSLSSNYR